MKSIKEKVMTKEGVIIKLPINYKFHAQTQLKEDLTELYTCMELIHDFKQSKQEELKVLNSKEELDESEQRRYKYICAMSLAVLKLSNERMKPIYNKLEETYKYYLDLYLYDNEKFKTYLYINLKRIYGQEFDLEIVNFISNSLGVRMQNVKRLELGMLKPLSKREYLKVVYYVLIQCALDKRQLSIAKIEKCEKTFNEIVKECQGLQYLIIEKRTKKELTRCLKVLFGVENKDVKNLTIDELEKKIQNLNKRARNIVIMYDYKH